MKVLCRVPARGEVDLAELLAGLTAAPPASPTPRTCSSCATSSRPG